MFLTVTYGRKPTCPNVYTADELQISGHKILSNKKGLIKILTRPFVVFFSFYVLVLDDLLNRIFRATYNFDVIHS